MIKQLDDRVADLIRTVSTNDANTSIIQDALTVELKNAVNRQDFISQEVDKHKHEIAFEKNQADQRYAMTQSQVALAASQNSQSSGGSARRSNEPLVTHKLLLNKASLDGSESHDAFDDWYNDMADDFELLLPGSKALMKLAEKSTEPCTTDWMMRQENAGLACTTSRELFSVLKRKTNLRARNQLKALSENQGLEAWRLIRANLSRKDNQRLQSEFDTLTSLVKIKVEEFSSFPMLQSRWESELLKFAAIDSEYKLGKFQQRNILYRALPSEVQIDLDKEQSRDETLGEYDNMVKFLTNLSRTKRFQKTSTPKPFSANLVDDN